MALRLCNYHRIKSIQLPQFQRKQSRINFIKAYFKRTSDDKSQLPQRSMYMILKFIGYAMTIPDFSDN